MTAFPSVQSSYRRLFRAAVLLLLAVFFPGPLVRGVAQASAAPATLIVIPDHKLDVMEWAALTAEVERSHAEYAAKVPWLGEQVELVRGEDVAAGVNVRNGIFVYLHGECSLMPGSKHVVVGALGWVPIVQRRIQPFIHVDCDRIGEMLGPLALGMHEKRRDTVMAEAIARVILHEWIHFAEQTTGHVERGITKSQFLVSDLLADDVDYQPRTRHHRERKREPGL